jgi:thioredoxin reductase (NADPH)
VGELDLIILGAGPAGLSAAVVAQVLKLRAITLDASDRPGGQLLRNPTPIRDCAGLDSPTGMALAEELHQHLVRVGGEVMTGRRVTRIDAERGEVEASGELLRARFLLLATGARPRTLGIPGERDEPGRGPCPAARSHGHLYKGRSVLVVGGGDLALEEALLFADICERVTLVHRGSRFRARPDFRAHVAASPRIDVRMNTALIAIEGESEVEGARLEGPAGASRVEVAGVFICAGIAPHSELLRGQIDMDPLGYIITDMQQRTSAPRLYAAGDVCAGSAWSVAAALGQGAAAVKDMERRICADGDLPP